MPKLPNDMSEEAIARRAKMSEETRVVPNPPKGRYATDEEIAAYKEANGLPPDAVVFLCRR